jgi:hypothetical protein
MAKPDRVNKAYQEFFGFLPPSELKTEWEELFLEWLIFDYKQTGRMTFLTEYVLKNPDKLEKQVISQFEQIVKTHFYSMFEIQEIKKGEWFILEDIFSGKTYQVYEKKGTLIIKGKGAIPGRIAEVNGCWYLVGANPIHFPVAYTDKFKENVKKMKIKNYSPRDTVELLIAHESGEQRSPPRLTKKQIKNKRKKLKKIYEKNVSKYGLGLSFEKLIEEVYKEDRVSVLDFFRNLIKKGLTEEFFLEKMKVLEDIWNYFPHKCLNDLSPIEAYNKVKEAE